MAVMRDYSDDDSDALWSLFERSLAGYGFEPDTCHTDRDLLDVRAGYIESGGRFRVLTEGPDILGMYGLYNRGGGTAELRKMYLEPRHKGRGFGKRLLEDAIRLARDMGFSRLVLETNSVFVEALGLYERYGFSRVSRDDLSKHCDIAMSLDLVRTKNEKPLRL